MVVGSSAIGGVAERFGRSPELAALFGSYDDEPAAEDFFSQYKNLLQHYIHQRSSARATTFWP